MGHTMDGRGIKPSGGFQLVPPGRYKLEIIAFEERKSNNGDYQVVVDSQVVEPKTIENQIVYGSKVKWHRVTFLPRGSKGAGIWMHWLKQIGEPWGEMERLDIEPKRWIGRKFWAKVIVESYERQDGTAGSKNVIKEVEGGCEPIWKEGDPVRAAIELQTPAPAAATPSNGSAYCPPGIGGDDDIPF